MIVSYGLIKLSQKLPNIKIVKFGKNGSSNYLTKICYFLVCIQNDAIVVVVVVIAVVVLVIFIVFVAAVISDDVVIVSVAWK